MADSGKNSKENKSITTKYRARWSFTRIGKPEPLKYGKSGSFSRRIDDTNRLVYEVSDDQIIVKSCKGHYNH